MSGYIAPSAEAAQAEQDRRRGPQMRLKPGRTYKLRLMPAFKSLDGKGIWFSVRRKHWKIPVPGTTDTKTFACPKEKNQPCYICDMADSLKPTLPQMAKDFAPNLSYMFNVIDVDSPGFGVQQLEDGATLFNLLLGIVQALPTVADPVQGQVLNVNKLPQAPWRTVVPAEVKSFDEMGLPIETAYTENLVDLDEAWNYIDYDEQKALFVMIEQNPHAIAATMNPAGAIAAPVPAAVMAPPIETTVVPAAVTTAPAPAAPVAPVAPAPAAPVTPAPAVVVAPAPAVVVAPAPEGVDAMQAALTAAAEEGQ